jgi:1,5-anhydro-D-fructose reductase (1,5-anhydro-D-mannitol-forming)
MKIVAELMDVNNLKNMNKNIKTVRWGIIGCGDVTEVKSGPAYQKTEGFTIVAVMRRDAEKAADYAKRHGISKYYTDVDELINDPEVDAVYIATPPDTHKYYGLKVALAGKPCCIEKPLAPNYQDSLSIVEAFEIKNIPLFVAYYRRTLPRFGQIKKWIDSEMIGKVRHIRWHLSKPTTDRDRSTEYNWRTDIKIATGGYFDDLASHGLDLFIHYFGTIKEVSGVSLNQQDLYTSKDATAAYWLHESGVTGSGSWNFGSFEREDIVEIYGSKGKIIFSVFENTPIILKTEEGESTHVIEHPENIQLYHVEQMREHLLGNSEHPSSGFTATHTSWVMDQIIGN